MIEGSESKTYFRKSSIGYEIDLEEYEDSEVWYFAIVN